MTKNIVREDLKEVRFTIEDIKELFGEKSEIGYAIKKASLHDSDSIRFNQRVKTLEDSNSIPLCRGVGNCEFPTNTAIAKHAHMYIDVLEESVKNPNMTLKEYLEKND